LGVEDIPGAISPEAANKEPAAEGEVLTQGESNQGRRGQLAAMLRRRQQQGGGGGGGGAGLQQTMRGGGARRRGQRGGGAGAASGEPQDDVAKGRQILNRLNQRMGESGAGGGQQKRGLVMAIKQISRGYDELEQEVNRLRTELSDTQEKLRTLLEQGD